MLLCTLCKCKNSVQSQEVRIRLTVVDISEPLCLQSREFHHSLSASLAKDYDMTARFGEVR